MEYNRKLTAEEVASLQAKADRDGTTITEMLDTKIAQYLEAVATDNNADAERMLAAKLSAMTPEQKASLAESL